jgi:hypothetical protein
MRWLDPRAFRLIKGAAQSRLSNRRRVIRLQRPKAAASRSSLAAILYVASALRTRPRGIDSYIDYFGEPAFSHR